MEQKITIALQETIKELYKTDFAIDAKSIQRTRKDVEGDFTIVVFPFLKVAKKNVEIVAQEIGEKLSEKLSCQYQVIKGFINLSFPDEYWLHFSGNSLTNSNFGYKEKKNEKPIVIEYSSPNTNKPLHLGHIRNNLLGSSLAKILTACGEHVLSVNLVNDRGIHICKSMLAWQKYGNNETPESSGLKGDHLVGKYYVEFDLHYKDEVKELMRQGLSQEEAVKKAPLLLEAQELLQRWEKGEPVVIELWEKMNDWVYKGFEETYRQLGISFDKTYYESETYLIGKEIVQRALKDNIFIKKSDNSVWVDLRDEGLDEKLLLRSDGTSVYMTQDIGTAFLRYEDFSAQKMIYVVGNEQNYHFDVLKLILTKKLNTAFGNSIFHLSYGMVELPEGKMKSREGTVVDADDLIEEMILQARKSSEALGKNDFTDEEAEKLYRLIGLGALKYFILKVDPKKNMLFNPNESIDLNGNTAPFIQYSYARIASLLRKAEALNINYLAKPDSTVTISKNEKELIKSLNEFPKVIENAGEQLNPAIIANYLFELAKDFNRFYQETPILKEPEVEKQKIYLQMSKLTSITLKNGMALLGIEVPEKM